MIALCAFMLSCDDDDEKKQSNIVGRWAGDRAELRFNMIPYNDENFNITLEFKTDGTVVLVEDNNTVTGTYRVDGDDLTLTGVDVVSIPVAISGEYDIEQLTDTRLVLEGDRQGEYTDPNGQTISGNLKAILHFNRIN